MDKELYDKAEELQIMIDELKVIKDLVAKISVSDEFADLTSSIRTMGAELVQEEIDKVQQQFDNL